ncbi:phage tail domain-containing protein [Limosilactobacillus agrestimuris]|uniref:phage tail domain-containing protein n=1 Tax=Limosilactobacillus agrestimuris TaxID=2941331 RepID=UPI0020411984|nr:phage tail domain-containing protein [Limosilactobacillus agrestimuris]
MVQVFSTKKDVPSMYPFLLPTENGVGARKYYHYQPIEYSISADGKTWDSCFDVPDLEGVYCYRSPDVQPAVQTDNLKKVGLMDGQRLLSSSYDTRQITMQVVTMDNIDESDSLLAYDALQRFLVSREAYWICFSQWPQRMYYVRAKLSAPTFTANSWSATVTFTDLIGLSRSVTTSVNYEDYLGFGNNFPDKKLHYTFTSNSFTVYNSSNVMIDPQRRGHELKITLDGSSSGNMRIFNKTTNTEFGRTGMVTDSKDGSKTKKSDFSGRYVINGIRPTLNGKSDYLNCDGGVIVLDKGPNTIEIQNFSGKVAFDFPFWWLS